jgi:LDH2 family malate/lactate/ureidoglycolate dehydrogenase
MLDAASRRKEKAARHGAPEATMASSVSYVTASAFRDFSAAIFERLGLPEPHALIVADCLVKANLRGLDSHGVARIPIYAKRLRLGLVNPRPTLAVNQVAPSAASLDGEDGMGMVVGTKAMEAAITLARDTGVGLVGVQRSTHYGMAAYYVLLAAAADHIGFAFTNSSPGMAPFGGTKPILGVNPLAVGVPAGRRPAVVLDMAMSEIARGKMRLAAMHGEPIAEGLGVDAQGRPTTDGMAVFGGGAVNPFGGPKGSALAIWMEIMGGVLTGAAFAGEMKSLYEDFSGPQRIGHAFMAIRPDLFMPLPEFTARMDTMIDRLKDSGPAAGVDEVLMPGEPEFRREAERRRTGIPLTTEVLATLESEAASLAISLPPLSKTPIVSP